MKASDWLEKVHYQTDVIRQSGTLRLYWINYTPFTVGQKWVCFLLCHILCLGRFTTHTGCRGVGGGAIEADWCSCLVQLRFHLFTVSPRSLTKRARHRNSRSAGESMNLITDSTGRRSESTSQGLAITIFFLFILYYLECSPFNSLLTVVETIDESILSCKVKESFDKILGSGTQVWISPKIKSIIPLPKFYLPAKFQKSQSTPLWLVLLTNKPTRNSTNQFVPKNDLHLFSSCFPCCDLNMRFKCVIILGCLCFSSCLLVFCRTGAVHKNTSYLLLHVFYFSHLNEIGWTGRASFHFASPPVTQSQTVIHLPIQSVNQSAPSWI